MNRVNANPLRPTALAPGAFFSCLAFWWRWLCYSAPEVARGRPAASFQVNALVNFEF